MIPRLCTKKNAWMAAAFLPGFFGLLITAGCGSASYPDDLKYPLRSDPLVVLSLNNAPQPSQFDKPGEFAHMFEDTSFPLLQYKDGPNYALRFPGMDPRTGKPGIQEKYLDRLDAAL